jgi:hypothetical protein
MQPRDLRAAIADLTFDSIAHVQDSGDRILEFAILSNPLRDRLFVDDLGCMVFTISDPRTKSPVEETS